MGGRGSGRTGGPGMWRTKCHEMHSIDLARWKKQGWLTVGRHSSVIWSCRGRETGNVQYRIELSGLRLMYRTRRQGEDWARIDELIPFIHTKTNFQGWRLWFRCPSCSRRCRIIYGGRYFRCRLCHDLKYETQYEPAFARAATRALKIRERLGCDGGIGEFFPEKPKGMHWKTYERLQNQYDALCDGWASGIMTRFRMFEP